MAVVSLNPEDFTGGGLLNDVDITITGADFRNFTYPSGQTVPALIIAFEDEEGNPYEQAYSAGRPEDFQPSDDGDSLELAQGTKKTQLSKTCNLAYFLQSLSDAGFPPERIAKASAKEFVGIRAHVVRKAFGKQQNSDKDREVLIVESLLDDAPAKTSGKTETPAAKATSGGDSVETEVVNIVTDIIMEEGGEITRHDLIRKILSAVKGNSNAKDIVKTANPAFLGKHFSVEGNTISLA